MRCEVKRIIIGPGDASNVLVLERTVAANISHGIRSEADLRIYFPALEGANDPFRKILSTRRKENETTRV